MFQILPADEFMASNVCRCCCCCYCWCVVPFSETKLLLLFLLWMRTQARTHTYYDNRLPNLKLWFIYTVSPHTYTHARTRLWSEKSNPIYSFATIAIIISKLFTFWCIHLYVRAAPGHGENDQSADTYSVNGFGLCPIQFFGCFSFICTNKCVLRCVMFCIWYGVFGYYYIGYIHIEYICIFGCILLNVDIPDCLQLDGPHKNTVTEVSVIFHTGHNNIV